MGFLRFSTDDTAGMTHWRIYIRIIVSMVLEYIWTMGMSYLAIIIRQ